MIPWLYFWAPQVHYPFSGDVAQRIDPSTQWFFDSILPTAGDAQIERKAFDIASYGRQLGLITELVIAIADEVQPASDKAQESLRRLKRIQTEIDRLKEEDASTLMHDIEDRVARLARLHKGRYPHLHEKLQRTLAEIC
jgi:hypothetical protein